MILGLTGVQTVWHVVLTDGTVVRWAFRRDGTIVRTAGRDSKNFYLENRAESSDITLNSRIPDKTTSIHTSDFVQTE
jgi:outer membrane lipoprotein-sorting protein